MNIDYYVYHLVEGSRLNAMRETLHDGYYPPWTPMAPLSLNLVCEFYPEFAGLIALFEAWGMRLWRVVVVHPDLTKSDALSLVHDLVQFGQWQEALILYERFPDVRIYNAIRERASRAVAEAIPYNPKGKYWNFNYLLPRERLKMERRIRFGGFQNQLSNNDYSEAEELEILLRELI